MSSFFLSHINIETDYLYICHQNSVGISTVLHVGFLTDLVEKDLRQWQTKGVHQPTAEGKVLGQKENCIAVPGQCHKNTVLTVQS